MVVGTVHADPKHIIFAFVDHFEPYGTIEEADQMTSVWVDDYINMAAKHTDADGRHPIHSYFVVAWPYIQIEQLNSVLNKLNTTTYTGYGEVELHIHHGLPDESLRTGQEATEELLYILSLAKQNFNAHGALLTAEPEPRTTFGFIHGMWALDNSRYMGEPNPDHYEYCGVKRELDILKSEGAYADFTFPAPTPMNTIVQDVMLYAQDDNSSASYNKSSNIFPVGVGWPERDNLMLIQGPSTRTNIGVKPGIYNDPPGLRRMDSWVNRKVCVIGNDDWIFVKVYTHGCAADLTDPDVWDSYFGETTDEFYNDIEAKYNDGINWKLHYVSSREMYNIIKAAEAGYIGDPNSFRDFTLLPYANMVFLTNNQYRLINYDKRSAWIEILDNLEFVEISMKHYSANAIILESNNEGGPIELSDATKDSGQYNELHFVDITPSKFYYILKSN